MHSTGRISRFYGELPQVVNLFPTSVTRDMLLASVSCLTTLWRMSTSLVGCTSAKNRTNGLSRGENVHSHCAYTFLIRDIKSTWPTSGIEQSDCSCSFRKIQFVLPRSDCTYTSLKHYILAGAWCQIVTNRLTLYFSTNQIPIVAAILFSDIIKSS